MEPVVITGMGVVTPIGCNTEQFWSNLLSGVHGVKEISAFDVSKHANKRGCEVDDAYAYVGLYGKKLGKATSMFLTAAEDALFQAGLDLDDPLRIGISVGTTMGELEASRPSLNREIARGPQAIAEQITSILHLSGPKWTMTNACAAGNFAVAQAVQDLISGRADAMIAGGVDVLSWTAFTGFGSLRAMSVDWCRPFDADRKGLLLGEGAGVVVLERERDARSRGAAILARVLGYGLTCDAYHITQPDPEAGGAQRSMREALRMAGLAPGDIGYVSAHGTGTLANDRMEAYALNRLFGEEAMTSSIKGHIGHTLGAASAIELVACVHMLATGWLPHTLHLEQLDPACRIQVIAGEPKQNDVNYILNNAYAFGGINSSVALGKGD